MARAAAGSPSWPKKTARSADRTPYEVSERVARQASVRPYQREPGAPLVAAAADLHARSVGLGRSAASRRCSVPYEKLEPGPVGSLFQIDCHGRAGAARGDAARISTTPICCCRAASRRTPANGRFHLQMVYAVCSLTYAAFRRALGRDIAWAATRPRAAAAAADRPAVRLRGRNAGYSREGGDLSFGYLQRAGKSRPASPCEGADLHGAVSHDIIVHETTHALLDGLRSSFLVPTNVDVPAFHEGFADLVALFLHFTYAGRRRAGDPRVARRASRAGSLLTDLAREFGYARSEVGDGAALRSASTSRASRPSTPTCRPARTRGPVDVRRRRSSRTRWARCWCRPCSRRSPPSCERKTERLFRIAGLDPQAVGRVPLSDALVKALAQEASDVAGQFLDICIRAIDYCPPADMELGEYLRALITADGEMEHDDKWGLPRGADAVVPPPPASFPTTSQFMTEDAVRWQPPARPLRIPGLAFRRAELRRRARAARRRRGTGAPGARARHVRHATASTQPAFSSWRRARRCRRASS